MLYIIILIVTIIIVIVTYLLEKGGSNASPKRSETKIEEVQAIREVKETPRDNKPLNVPKSKPKKSKSKYIEPEDTEFEAAITKQVEDFNNQTKVANKEEGARDRSKYQNKDT